MADKGMNIYSLKNKKNGKEYVDYLFRERSEDPYGYFKDEVYIKGLSDDLNDTNINDWEIELIVEGETSLSAVQDIVELHIQARESLIPDGYNKNLGIKIL